MKKHIKFLVVAFVAVLSLQACESFDEPGLLPQQPTVEDVGGSAYYSTFYLPKLWVLAESVADGDIFDIKLELLPLAKRLKPYVYDATLTVGSSYAIRFFIDSETNEDLPSGSYLLKAYSSEGLLYDSEFVLTIEDRCVKHSEIVPNYAEEIEYGDGTAENPYLISSGDVFEAVCKVLDKDKSHGAGKHFLQTQNIEISSNNSSSSGVVEEGWFNVDFAGVYDGGNFTVTGFSFNGARDEVAENIGLFRTLRNGAVVKNLRLSCTGISGVAKNAGILAGTVAEGAIVEISDCTLSGTISNSGNSIGGLIGYVYGADVKMNNINIGVNILCESNDVSDTTTGYRVGGLVGFAVDSSLDISNVEVYLNSMKIYGGWCVGGLIGESRDSAIDVVGADLEIPTTKDLGATVRGRQYVGGAIGYLDMNGDEVYFDNNSYVYAISGDNYVGGLIGRTYSKCPEQHVTMKDVYISSEVEGVNSVGGFIGYASNAEYHSTYLTFTGRCCFGPISSNVTSIKGQSNVGGLVGATYKDVRCLFETADEVMVASDITASVENAGGVIGYAENVRFNLYNYTPSPNSKIYAPKCAGGVIGYMNGGTLSGSTSQWDFDSAGCEKVPAFSELNAPVVEVKIQVEDASSQYIGGVVGRVGANTTVRDFVTSSEITGGKYVGGIVGGAVGNNILLEGLYPSGMVKGLDIEIGGIAGRIEGGVTIKNSINYARLENNDSAAEIGGVVGYAKYNGDKGGMPHVYYSVNVAPIKACEAAGGVVGILYVGLEEYNSILPIERCANFGKITGFGNSSYGGYTGFGGILGNSYNTQGVRIAHCANFGDLEVNCSSHGVGGIVGAIGNDPKGVQFQEEKNYHVHSCANYGNITGSSGGFHCGGLVGYMEEGDMESGNHACFEGCYNWGDIDVAVDDDHGLGGLAGYMDSYAELWWNINFKEPSGHNSSENTGHIWGKKKGEYTTEHNYNVYDTAAMANADNFADLKINATDSYWVMSAGDPHPRIKDCPFQNATYIPDSK
ncbi:MAG: hypothetical protein J6R38_04800 [Alistipes sp.]|nr:hypothetical protein [Alistipes sp.]